MKNVLAASPEKSFDPNAIADKSAPDCNSMIPYVRCRWTAVAIKKRSHHQNYLGLGGAAAADSIKAVKIAS